MLSEAGDAASLDAYVRTLGVTPADFSFEIAASQHAFPPVHLDDNLARLKVRGYSLAIDVCACASALAESAYAHFAEIKLRLPNAAAEREPGTVAKELSGLLAMARKQAWPPAQSDFRPKPISTTRAVSAWNSHKATCLRPRCPPTKPWPGRTRGARAQLRQSDTQAPPGRLSEAGRSSTCFPRAGGSRVVLAGDSHLLCTDPAVRTSSQISTREGEMTCCVSAGCGWSAPGHGRGTSPGGGDADDGLASVILLTCVVAWVQQYGRPAGSPDEPVVDKNRANVENAAPCTDAKQRKEQRENVEICGYPQNSS